MLAGVGALSIKANANWNFDEMPVWRFVCRNPLL